ncbi:tyrosine-type recombinase/integrase [Streptomyces flavotricini]|uniref:Tyrosine-type recombinase/integrase n=1 Tax=Streptomyces flavotricini TaxID=66888 RepID=A0ABS8E0Z1_9ACTN|nr:tyrosine-type recombinase/integrase [Streptomyces flavotricini]MCC0094594.1 tyrosine-type recombinase/integrase [Streptomyces flavotricini]
MAATTTIHGTGTVFKDCGHAPSYWPKCAHGWKIRYRNAFGKQSQESGFPDKDKASERLLEIHNQKASKPANQAKAERIARYGQMRFDEYATAWKEGQRHLAPASVGHLDSLLQHHLYPAFGSRRMGTFDHKVVDGFIRTMERNGAGLATQSNAFDKLKAILLDAHRLGLFEESPLLGVQAPVYDPKKAVIPSPEQLRNLRLAGDDIFTLLVDVMSGCGLRNAEAAAVNVNNIVADDVYRVTEQVNQTTKHYERLKHRKPGEYRDVPLPARVRDSIEWYADKYGTVDGYLLRHPHDAGRPYQPYLLQNQWQRLKRSGALDIPEGMVIYGCRHFFASNCLAHRIPITDVAEWMGHKSLEITFKIYRHLMPGSIGQAAKMLNVELTA